MNQTSSVQEILGCAEAPKASLRLRVERARPHSLVVSFDDRATVPRDGLRFDRLTLNCGGREQVLGPCLFEEPPPHQRRREDRLLDPGDGRLTFVDCVYDFRSLFRTGRVIDLTGKVDQLPLVWNRKNTVKASFRELVSHLLFELQVYRGVFDDLDRNLEDESAVTRSHVQRVAVQTQYPAFAAFFDERLRLLEDEIRDYNKQEHEQHGFYFRKQLWDLILSSEFLARTNLKPRGYAGDSVMMRMIYQNEFRGPTVFSQLMHHHPLETAAAQAVRNRRAFLAGAINEAYTHRGPLGDGDRIRVLSVACGPAWELRDILRTPNDFGKYEVVLLDQDRLALNEASQTISLLEAANGVRLQATTVRHSVRTMLHTDDLADRWGRFQLIYSMGLFDYLTQPVAKQVLARLYQLVAPGGEIIVGNFHPRNATRAYMGYWMDWVLCYRDEAELLDLAAGLDGAETELVFEPTRSQLFMRVRRP